MRLLLFTSISISSWDALEEIAIPRMYVLESCSMLCSITTVPMLIFFCTRRTSCSIRTITIRFWTKMWIQWRQRTRTKISRWRRIHSPSQLTTTVRIWTRTALLPKSPRPPTLQYRLILTVLFANTLWSRISSTSIRSCISTLILFALSFLASLLFWNPNSSCLRLLMLLRDLVVCWSTRCLSFRIRRVSVLSSWSSILIAWLRESICSLNIYLSSKRKMLLYLVFAARLMLLSRIWLLTTSMMEPSLWLSERLLITFMSVCCVLEGSRGPRHWYSQSRIWGWAFQDQKVLDCTLFVDSYLSVLQAFVYS